MTDFDKARKRLEACLKDGAENGFYSGGGYKYIEVAPEDARTILDALDDAEKGRDRAIAALSRYEEKEALVNFFHRMIPILSEPMRTKWAKEWVKTFLNEFSTRKEPFDGR